MPRFGPIKRDDLIYYFRCAGLAGPYGGGSHQYMVKDRGRLWIPNSHTGDIGREFLARRLRQAGNSRDEWEKL
jgi:hypothetical protein